MGRLKPEESEAKRIQFGIWLGMPKSCRSEDEKTASDMAKKLEVFIDTVYDWQKDPFVLKVAENAMKFYGADHKKEVIDSLIYQASHGNVPAQKLFLEWQKEIGTSRNDTKIMEAVRIKHVTKE